MSYFNVILIPANCGRLLADVYYHWYRDLPARSPYKALQFPMEVRVDNETLRFKSIPDELLERLREMRIPFQRA